jgi:hypothetical protein
MVKDATPKETMMSRGVNYSAKQKRLENDEKELEELMKKQNPQANEAEEEPQVDEDEDDGDDVVETQESSDDDDSRLTAEEKSFKKRYGDLRRHMSEKEKEWKERLEALEARLEGSQVRPPKSDEDIEAWAKKYPDVASIVERIAEKKAEEKFSKADARLREIDEAKYEAERTKAENKIRKAHSDFDELRDSDGFHNWVEDQPKWVREALYENADDPDSVIRVIDLYKVDNGQTPAAKRDKAKDAAKSVSKGQRSKVDAHGSEGMIKESDVAKMTDAQFAENYDRIQDAMRTGKFVYDVSQRR